MMRIAISLLMGASLLSGCTTLPTDEATGFQKVAGADRDAFANVARTEESSIATRAELLAAGRPGEYLKEGCDFDFRTLAPPAPAPPLSLASGAPAPAPAMKDGTAAQKVCSLTFQPTGDPLLTPTLAAPKTRALIAAIAAYADKMSELATAKDVATAQAAVDGLATTISGIALAAGATAPVAAAIEFADVATKAAFVTERRRKLLEAANRAETPIDAAAAAMNRISRLLQQNIEASAADRIRLGLGAAVTEQDLLSCVGGTSPMRVGAAFDEAHCAAIRHAPAVDMAVLERAARARLAAVNADLFKASADYNDAVALQTDYHGLVDAHEALVTALKKSSFSAGAALTDLNSVVSKLKPSK